MQQSQEKRQEEKNKGEGRKEERRKQGSGQRAKPSTPTLAIDALIGEEEENGKKEEG